MVIIWGSKHYAKPMPEVRHGHCTCCNSGTRFEITDVFDKATIYYIPTISMNHKYYARCVQCGAYYQIKEGAASLVFGRNKDLPIDPADMTLVQEGASATRSTDESGAEYDDPFAAQDAASVANQLPPWEKKPEVKPAEPGSAMKVFGVIAMIVAIIAGLGFFMSYPEYKRIQNEGLLEVNQLLAGENSFRSGQTVTLDVNGVIAQYASETGKSNETGYYIIWLDDGSFVSASTSHSDEKTALDKLEEQTWAYLDGKLQSFTEEPLTLKGKVQALSNMDYKLRMYYDEVFDSLGVSDSDVHQFNISSDPKLGTSQNVRRSLTITLIAFVIAIVCFVVSGRQKRRAVENSETQTAVSGGAE